MIKPMIHLNGTSKDVLATQYNDAVTVLRGAIQALEDAAPNARDYYPMGEAAPLQAIREHGERLKKLRSVLSELTEIRDACIEQGRSAL
jgi:hypothetical protein